MMHKTEQDAPNRVLIGGFTANTGGMESYVMNLYRSIDRNRLQFDFLKMSGTMAFEDEIRSLGGIVHFIPGRSKGIKAHYDALENVFSGNRYAALYYQCNRRLDSLDVIRIAKAHGVPKRIVHSHNTKDAPDTVVNKLRRWYVDKKMYRYLTHCFACSNEAGRWMFADHGYTVVPNSVDTGKYKYNPEIRERKRAELNIMPGAFVVGSVARLSRQKNPLFLLNVFEAVHRRRPDAVLLQVGDGELKEQFRNSVQDKHLENCVKMLGNRTDVAELLSAMDVFLLPSYYEGFPISLVEAQCNGLTSVVADTTTRDCNLTGLLKYISLECDLDYWAKAVLQDINENRAGYDKRIERAGYGNKAITERMANFFLDERPGRSRGWSVTQWLKEKP